MVLAHTGHAGGAGGGHVAGVLLAVLFAGAYLVAVGRDRRGWSRWRTASWLAGCTVLAVAVAPLGATGDPRAHMGQHLLLGMLAPLGLVMGAPVTLLLRVTTTRVRGTVVRVLHWPGQRVLAHPVTAAVLGTGGLYLVLLTPLYAAAQEHELLHAGVHVHYVVSGYLFAWAIAGADPAPRRPGLPVRAVTLLVAAAAHAVLAKYLYAHAGVLPPGAGHDAGAARAAAQLMYYGGDVAELLLAAAMFADWYRRRGRRLARAVAGPGPATGPAPCCTDPSPAAAGVSRPG